MRKGNLAVDDIVQINPDSHEIFGGCLMIVTEVKSWGAQGAITAPKMKEGIAYYRCNWKDMERVGKCWWAVDVSYETKEPGDGS